MPIRLPGRSTHGFTPVTSFSYREETYLSQFRAMSRVVAPMFVELRTGDEVLLYSMSFSLRRWWRPHLSKLLSQVELVPSVSLCLVFDPYSIFESDF